jgi:hypothetical protein
MICTDPDPFVKKKVRNNLDFYCLRILCDFLYLKTDDVHINVPFGYGGMDPRIRIRTKMSRILNTAEKSVLRIRIWE